MAVTDLRRIESRRGSRIIHAAAPLRQLQGPAGDRFTAGLVQWTPASARLLFPDHSRPLEVSGDALNGVQSPGGLIDVLWEDYETDSASQTACLSGSGRQENDVPETAVAELPEALRTAQSGSCAFRLRSGFHDLYRDESGGIAAGRLAMAMRPDTTADSTGMGARWQIVLEFDRDGEPESLRLFFDAGREFVRFRAPDAWQLAWQPVRLQDDWQWLTVLHSAPLFRVLIGDRILLSGPAVNARLIGVRVASGWAKPAEDSAARDAEPVGASAAAGCWFDNLHIQRMSDAGQVSFRSAEDDLLLTASSDELYGTLLAATSRSLSFRGPGPGCGYAWSEAAFIRRREVTRSSKPVTGLIAELQLHPLADYPAHEPDVLTAAITAANSRLLRLSHPYLGEFSLPLRHIRQIVPKYVGTRVILLPGTVHLGNEIRHDFTVPQPAGTRVWHDFHLRRFLPGRVTVLIDVAEMEPSGPQTPPGSPHLDDLRDGGLQTLLYINGWSLGDLNSELTWRADAGKPRRLRFAGPYRRWGPESSSWSITQKPSRHDRRRFDDCEVSRLILEIHHDPTSDDLPQNGTPQNRSRR